MVLIGSDVWVVQDYLIAKRTKRKGHEAFRFLISSLWLEDGMGCRQSSFACVVAQTPSMRTMRKKKK